jgi:hypothetical protein
MDISKDKVYMYKFNFYAWWDDGEDIHVDYKYLEIQHHSLGILPTLFCKHLSLLGEDRLKSMLEGNNFATIKEVGKLPS